MMYSAEEKIKWFAISSRIVVLAIQFLANYLIPDHEAGVFKKPRQPDRNEFVEVLASGLTRWDGQYFLHIAEYGYTYENTLAFFPLFPVLIRGLAYPFQILVDSFPSVFILTTHDTLVLASILVNNFLFTHSARLLYKLTLKVTSNERLSYTSALLFCVNPASVFFSAVYSESLFCFLTLSGLVGIESGHTVTASLFFGLSSMTRSNGLINIGYILYRQITRRKQSVLLCITCSLIACLPFTLYQVFCYLQFCENAFPTLSNELIINHSRLNDYIMPGNRSIWCENTVPLAYSYVQNHYWKVGFLEYYETKQLPNFALAFPVLALSVSNAFEFFHNHGKTLIRSGLMFDSQQKTTLGLSLTCFPYVLHTFALALFALLFMHVQVSTRFIFSSCPGIYWFCAKILISRLCVSKEARIQIQKNPNKFYESLTNRSSKWKTFILNERFLGLALIIRYYFFAYFLAGPTIFANHLPWT